jgi:hypothetical protein
MDAVQALLAVLKEDRHAKGNFLGLLNVLIGRRVEDAQGAVVSTGMNWRALAASLKKARWDPKTVRELGLDPAHLPPRDRERYWYAAISQAQIGSEKATQAGDRLARALASAGYRIGPAPGP